MAQHSNSPTHPRMVRGKERERLALEMRLAGAYYWQIADALGMTKSGAFKAVKRALKTTEEEIAEGSKRLRSQEAARVERLIQAVWERAIGTTELVEGKPVAVPPDLAAVDRVTKLLERRAKLLGIDKPTKLRVGGEDGGPIEIRSYRERVSSLVDRIAAEAEAASDPVEPQ